MGPTLLFSRARSRAGEKNWGFQPWETDFSTDWRGGIFSTEWRAVPWTRLWVDFCTHRPFGRPITFAVSGSQTRVSMALSALQKQGTLEIDPISLLFCRPQLGSPEAASWQAAPASGSQLDSDIVRPTTNSHLNVDARGSAPEVELLFLRTTEQRAALAVRCSPC